MNRIQKNMYSEKKETQSCYGIKRDIKEKREQEWQKSQESQELKQKESNGFFEGWYIKHENAPNMVSFIPAFHKDKYGVWTVSIQVITKDTSSMVYYNIEDVQVGTMVSKQFIKQIREERQNQSKREYQRKKGKPSQNIRKYKTVKERPSQNITKYKTVKGKPSQNKESYQIIKEKQKYNKVGNQIPTIKDTNGTFYLKIENNIFTEQGIHVEIETKELSIRGSIMYGDWNPLESNIMGPFQFFSSLQCNHGVLSLSHKLTGKLVINRKIVDFTNGTGYIEKDWGCSFPKKYLWTQCNWNCMDKQKNCIMLSIADIPIWKETEKRKGISFTGCIGVISYQGKQYRMATYQGVKILKCNPKEVWLKQGKYYLQVMLLKQKPYKLCAPVNGEMTRNIQESPICEVQYRFSKGNRTIFSTTQNIASFEVAKG